VEPTPEQLIVVSTDNENIKLTGVPTGSVFEVIVNVSSQAPVYVPNPFPPPVAAPDTEPDNEPKSTLPDAAPLADIIF
jgi:hypothetical protein